MSVVRRALVALVASITCGCGFSNGPVTLDCADGACGGADPGTSAASTPASAACVASPLVAATTACAPRAATADTLDQALGQVGLDRCSFSHTTADLSVSSLFSLDPRMQPDAVTFLQHPLAMPAYGASFAHDLDAAMAADTPIASAIAAAAARRGAPVQTCEDASWYAVGAADPAPLATALAAVGAGRADVTGVPRDLQLALAPIVRAIAASAKDVLAARVVDAATQQKLATVSTWMLGVRHFELDAPLVAAMDAVDVDGITRAAARVALVVERAKLARFAGVSVPALDVATPFGAIVLRGPASDTYAPGSAADGAAFVLDTGGDDVYRVALGASSVARPVSIAVDLAGRDTYAYGETSVPADAVGRRLPSDGAGRAPDGRTLSRTPRQGAGVLGVGMLVDLGAGADTYRSLVGSQGVGTHGVGVLYDDGGDDAYTAEGFSQGAAAWGIGLLLDRAGKDAYTLYTSGQGFGFTRGLGAIEDLAGDDAYVAIAGSWPNAPAALAGDDLYPSAQLPAGPNARVVGNWSLAQGCGAGHRPDWPDPGFAFPGGVGVLRDAAGDDAYGAGVFAQGVGFVQGMGALLDDGGDDTYDALYYAQGAAAHMGLALFDDRAGSDRYDTIAPIQAAALGLAHDLSAAVHVDEGGDDVYAAPPVALGTAEDNGLGLFVNIGGADRFASVVESFGAALIEDKLGAAREHVQTVGVFVKAGGSASYTIGDKDESRDGKCWTEGKGALKGVGVDSPTGAVALR